MADEESSPPPHRRDGNKTSVHNIAAQRRRKHAITLGKERREVLIRTKRMCREGFVNNNEASSEIDMIVNEEKASLDTRTFTIVEDLKSALRLQGKGATERKVDLLRALRHLLSKTEIPPIEAAIRADVIPSLAQCLSFGSEDEQLLEAAWCLTNIAAGEPEETKSLLPTLPLLIAHLGEKSSLPVAEQCAWALGNVAGEGEELRNILLAQGALMPLARLMMSDKGSMARTAAWALSNLIKGPDSRAATDLIKVVGTLDAVIRHLHAGDDELATEVAWVVVYLTALSEDALHVIAKSKAVPLLIGKLAISENLQLLIPVLRSLGNLIAGADYVTSTVLIVGQDVTDNAISALAKCLKSENRALKKEAAWVLSNISAGSFQHKELVFSSEVTFILLDLLSTAPFDIRKEVAFVLGNLCVTPGDGVRQPDIIVNHLVLLVNHGGLPGFLNLVRSPDVEAARLGLQFLELVMRGMPNGEGPKLVEFEDGIDAMERFQFHENEEMRVMANTLVDKYFGEDYGLDD
ncbi:importin subunit alpha-9 [Phalaenopsis equestris]|uniref:importin subunit alpha-9 n=1 Tax=Phalaenopsis equestris TaxID=78828 RepID=UPI0009E2C4CF|nr:importin subunit alpha-9 [Phalaenopsis equestris]